MDFPVGETHIERRFITRLLMAGKATGLSGSRKLGQKTRHFLAAGQGAACAHVF